MVGVDIIIMIIIIIIIIMVKISPITTQENVLTAQLSGSRGYIPLSFNKSNLKGKKMN